MVYHRQCTINLCNLGERQLEWFWVNDEPGDQDPAIPLIVNTIQSTGANVTKSNYAHALPIDGTFGAISFSLFAISDSITIPDQIALGLVKFTTITPENAFAAAFGGQTVPSLGTNEPTLYGVEDITAVALDLDSENTQLVAEPGNPEILRSCVTAPLDDSVFFGCDNLGVYALGVSGFGFLTFAQIQVSIASGSRP